MQTVYYHVKQSMFACRLIITCLKCSNLKQFTTVKAHHGDFSERIR